MEQNIPPSCWSVVYSTPPSDPPSLGTDGVGGCLCMFGGTMSGWITPGDAAQRLSLSRKAAYHT